MRYLQEKRVRKLQQVCRTYEKKLKNGTWGVGIEGLVPRTLPDRKKKLLWKKIGEGDSGSR